MRIFTYKFWKFGSNPYYHGWNTAFFSTGLFFTGAPCTCNTEDHYHFSEQCPSLHSLVMDQQRIYHPVCDFHWNGQCFKFPSAKITAKEKWIYGFHSNGSLSCSQIFKNFLGQHTPWPQGVPVLDSHPFVSPIHDIPSSTNTDPSLCERISSRTYGGRVKDTTRC